MTIQQTLDLHRDFNTTIKPQKHFVGEVTVDFNTSESSLRVILSLEQAAELIGKLALVMKG